MRNVILFIASSLDGYIATLSGGIDWLFTDQDYGYSEFITGIDTVIMGRKTYSQVLEFGDYPYSEMQGYVLTRSSPSSPQAPPSTDHPVTFVSDNIPQWMDSLRQAPGKDIWLVGGAELVQLFLLQDWIDRMILSIHPILLGQGIPLFLPADISPKSYTLEETEAFDTGLVQLTYRRSSIEQPGIEQSGTVQNFV